MTLDQVDLEGVALREPLPTHAARERPFACVQPRVSRQRAPLREHLPARAAPVRLLARVNPPVGRQVHLLDEGLVADAARERPLARVDPLVVPHMGLLRERLLAGAALERLLSRVRLLVPGQVSFQVAGVGAQEALVLPAFWVWAPTISYKFLAVRLAAAVPPVEALAFGSGGRTVKRLLLHTVHSLPVSVQKQMRSQSTSGLQSWEACQSGHNVSWQRKGTGMFYARNGAMIMMTIIIYLS